MDNHKHCKNCGRLIEDVRGSGINLCIALGKPISELKLYSWEQGVCINCLVKELIEKRSDKRTK